MKVEIWSDIACPWCYVGTARLDTALEQFQHRSEVALIHRSYELHPDYPRTETMPVLEMFQRRYGASPDQARSQETRLQRIANSEGLPFSLERDFGNTHQAHELAHFAAAEGRGHELMLILYRNYFSAEGDLFSVEGLVGIAEQAGLDPAAARSALETGRFSEAVRSDQEQAQRYQISGVPFFLIDETFAMSGGQSVATMLGALEQAWTTSHSVGSPSPIS